MSKKNGEKSYVLWKSLQFWPHVLWHAIIKKLFMMTCTGFNFMSPLRFQALKNSHQAEHLSPCQMIFGIGFRVREGSGILSVVGTKEWLMCDHLAFFIIYLVSQAGAGFMTNRESIHDYDKNKSTIKKITTTSKI